MIYSLQLFYNCIFLFLINSTLFAQVKQIPDFKFTRLQGGGDFGKMNIPKGGKTLFIFFDTECPHCMQAISTFNENEKILNNINLYLLTKDKKELAIPFLKNFGDKLIIKKIHCYFPIRTINSSVVFCPENTLPCFYSERIKN